MIRNLIIKHKETINNSLWRGLQILAKHGCTIAIFYLAASFLTPDKFGIYSYLITLLSMLLIFCDFGLSTATAKYTAEYEVKNPLLTQRILFSVSIIIILLAGFISVFILLAGPFIFKEYSLLLLFLPYLFFLPLSSVADGVYRGKKEFLLLSKITSIISIVSLILSYFIIKQYSLKGAIIAQNLFYFLLAVSLFIFRRDTKFKINRSLIKVIFKYGIILGLVNLMTFFYTSADVFILKHFDYVIEVGYFVLIQKSIRFLIIPFVIVSQVIGPGITQLYIKDRIPAILGKFQNAVVVVFVVSVLISIGLYFVSPIVLKNILPKYYTESFLLMINLMLVVLPFRLLYVIPNQGFVVPTGFANITLRAMIVVGLLNILLSYVFIVYYGYIGAIYSKLVCFPVAAIIILLLFRSKIRSVQKKI